MNSNPNPRVLNRVRSEYMEMPGLSLKSEQVQRLCGIDDDACKAVLDTLVEAGFLLIRDDGAYSRSRDGETSRLRAAKAALDSEVNASVARLRRRAS
jgi:hypothetical protein